MLTVSFPARPEDSLLSSIKAEVTVANAFVEVLNKSRTAKSVTTLRFEFAAGGGESWSGTAEDRFRRCVDNAMQRVYPPVDPLQYISDSSPVFADSTKSVTFEVHAAQASTRGAGGMKDTLLAPQYIVCGAADAADTGLPGCTLTWTESQALGDEALAPTDDGPTADDADLWRLARAPRLGTDAQVDNEAQLTTASSAAKLQWRLACWVAESMLNEPSWAATLRGTGAGGNSSAGGASQRRAAPHSWKVKPKFRYSNVLDAVVKNTKADEATGRRAVHADARGMEFNGTLVASSARFAYVAVHCPSRAPPSDDSASCTSSVPSWSLVCRVPVPSACAASWAEGRKRSRPTDSSEEPEAAAAEGQEKVKGVSQLRALCYNVDEVTMHDNQGSLVVLPEADRRTVTIRAHRVHCKLSQGKSEKSPQGSSASVMDPSVLSLQFEDAYVVGDASTPTAGGDADAMSVNSFYDLLGLIRESCKRYTHTCEKLHARYMAAVQPVAPPAPKEAEPEAEAETAAEGDEATKPSETVIVESQPPYVPQLLSASSALLNAMTDTASVHFKKPRGSQKSGVSSCVPVLQTCRDIASLRESAAVEFKFKVEAVGTGAKKQLMTSERLRNTLAAMASTVGGVVCVGVTDQGAVKGRPRGEVLASVRTSGFCPAMVKDTVSVRELRILTNAGGATSEKSVMPKDWWKQASSSTPSSSLATSSAQRSNTASDAGVVTVFTVAKGQAPFYTAGRTSKPYVRGCASTTPMPVLVMSRRLYRQLEMGL